MLDLGALRMSIVADTDKAQKELGSFKDKLSSAGKTMGKVGATLTAGITAPIVALGTVAVNTASDIEEGMNKMNAVFGESSKEVTKWADSSAKDLGMSKKQYIDTMSTIGGLSQDLLKMDEKQSADFSKNILGRAADISSYYNLSMEQSTALMQQLYSGETEGWKQLGITINDTTLQEYAHAQGINKKVSEMDLEEKTLLRVQMAMEKTNRASGDFKNTSDGLANQSRILKAQLSDTAAEIGEKLLPVITDVVGKLNDWLTKILDFAKEHPNIMSMIVGVTVAIAVLPPILMTIGGLITALTAASTALNIAMLPLTLIIIGITAAIAALVAIGILLYKNWDTIKAKCKEVWDAVKNKFQEVGDKFKKVWEENFKPNIDAMVNAWNTAKDAIVGAFGAIWDKCKEVFDKVMDKIQAAIDKAKELANSVVNFFTGGGKDKDSKPKSKNYNGLGYVPYDNYIAQLHKGERVLTASEAKLYNQGLGGNGGVNVVQNIYAPAPTPSEIARQTRNELKNLRLATV